MTTIWGIHNDALGAELVDEGFISVGWAVPDLRTIGADRDALKAVVLQHYPLARPGTVVAWAGVLYRFAFEMQQGDLVIAPYKPDRTLNFGIVSGPYAYHADVPRHPHRRPVTWLQTGVPRDLFPKAALYELGSSLTLFRVRRHAHEFEQFLRETRRP